MSALAMALKSRHEKVEAFRKLCTVHEEAIAKKFEAIRVAESSGLDADYELAADAYIAWLKAWDAINRAEANFGNTGDGEIQELARVEASK